MNLLKLCVDQMLIFLYDALFHLLQIKAELIRQREIELLKPSAGAGASEIVHLLRPTAEEGSSDAIEGAHLQASSMQKQPEVPPQGRRLAATASFYASAETLAAAAEVVFGSAAAEAGSGSADVSASEKLLGLSCAISKGGEVMSLYCCAASPTEQRYSTISSHC